MKAAEELEALYERKLAMHAARYDEMKGAKDDIQCEFEEKIEVMKREHAVQLERQLNSVDFMERVSESDLNKLVTETPLTMSAKITAGTEKSKPVVE